MPDIIQEMDAILQNEIAERHTFYQLKFFVLGAEPTVQGKLHCCLRELRSRRLSLDAMSREMEELKDQNTLLKIQIDRIAEEHATDENGLDLVDDEAIERFEKEREIEIRSLKRKLKANEYAIFEIQRKLKYVIEECQFFVSAWEQLTQEEKLLPWDSIEVQKEYWDAKLGREFRTRLILGQPLDNELVKAIEELHDDAPTKQAVLQLMAKQEEFNRQHGLPMPEAIVALGNEKEPAILPAQVEDDEI
jgi:predicted RNase H-like nuclease (RuvC/YqgF family)